MRRHIAQQAADEYEESFGGAIRAVAGAVVDGSDLRAALDAFAAGEAVPIRFGWLPTITRTVISGDRVSGDG